MESNHPSEGLLRPAGFEDPSGTHLASYGDSAEVSQHFQAVYIRSVP
jgi:hypothetical protein